MGREGVAMASTIEHPGWQRGTPRFKHQDPTRKRLKGRKERAEVVVIKAVRKAVKARDGYCLVATRIGIVGQCEGWSTWAHFAGHRRSQTRGLPPEQRHDTRFSGQLCVKHHQQEEDDLYEVVYHTAEYADGPISWQPKPSRGVIRTGER